MSDVALPRAVAARVTVRAIATTQRVLACAGIPIAALMVVDVLVDRGAAVQIPVVIAPFLGMLVLAMLVLWRPGVGTAALYLVGGAVCQVAVAVLGLDAVPTLDEPGVYLLNRIATAMCLVGAVGATALSGVVWTLLAAIVAHVSLMFGLSIAGSDAGVGFGPAIVASVSIAAYLSLLGAQRRVDRHFEPMHVSGEEVRLDAVRARLERRAASVVHDTLLADLALIARSSGTLTPRALEVLAQHDSRLTLATVAESPHEATTAARESGTSLLSAALLELAQEYQWSGVRVDVSGVEALDTRHDPPPRVRNAITDSVRAALDNVVRHAGTDRAELVAGVRDDRLSVLIVDDGMGFSVDDIAPDRLGVRFSIEQRMLDVGGSVRVWSSSEGTTVMLTAPIGGAE